MPNRNEPRRLALAIALVAAMAAPGVDALALNPRGEGQVLIYPYYTVDGHQQTVVTVVNTTAKVKAVRFNARESRNGVLVQGFNLYLGPYDTWTAAVTADATGAARLAIGDGSCTVPNRIGQSFNNYAYTGAFRDHPTSLAATLGALERTREGFIELIELGELRAGTGPTQLADEATPGASGVPANCAALDNAWRPTAPGGPTSPWIANRLADIDLPTGGLYGHGALIDVAGGTMVSYEAQALTGFYTNAANPGALHFAPVEEVSLAANDTGGGNTVATVAIDGATGTTPQDVTFPRGGIDAVSLVLMQSTIRNDFLVAPALGASTEWVVTMPTKHLHTNPAGNAPARAPFTQRFADTGRSCHAAGATVSNRDGLRRGAGDLCIPGAACPPPTVTLCTATTVIAMGQDGARSAIFGSRIEAGGPGVGLPVTTVGGASFDAGHVTLRFDDPATTAADFRMAAGAGEPVTGLPVVGFAAERIVNTNAQPGLLANYAGAYRHRGTLRRDGN